VAAPTYLRPSRAARCFPHDGKPPHPSKITRLIVAGVKSKGRQDQRIKLRAIRDSRGWLTTVEWIEDFVAQLTADRLGGQASNPIVEARAERATASLVAQGW
jgi:hypothetical protein